MKIFLVRHAASTDFDKKWSSPKSLLDDLGREQAQVLSQLPRLQTVDLILTSKWPRAKETAKIIAKAINKPLEVFLGIHERKQPLEIYDVARDSGISKQYIKESIENFEKLDWKFQGAGESFRNVVKRAIKFEKHLRGNHLGQSILVISHEVFIRCFVSICVLGENYTDDSFNKIFRSLHFTNTGVSLLEYDERRKIWKILYLNDFSHLKMVKGKTLQKN